jgi:hypothetical protein
MFINKNFQSIMFLLNIFQDGRTIFKKINNSSNMKKSKFFEFLIKKAFVRNPSFSKDLIQMTDRQQAARDLDRLRQQAQQLSQEIYRPNPQGQSQFNPNPNPMPESVISHLSRVPPRVPAESQIERNTTPSVSDILVRQSYETLIKRLYGMPVVLPKFLIINGVRSDFVPVEDMANMLSQNQIERYIIDPLLQPWAGAPPAGGTPPRAEYRIFTFFGKNGMTYLVRAKYNPETNQISP